jgi:hypothetical protein
MKGRSRKGPGEYATKAPLCEVPKRPFGEGGQDRATSTLISSSAFSSFYMSAFAAVLAEARQLRQLCSNYGLSPLPSHSPAAPAHIPAFHVATPPDIASTLRSLNLPSNLANNLLRHLNQHLESLRQHVSQEYNETAEKLLVSMRNSQHFAPTLQANLNLLVQTFQSRYERFAQQMMDLALRDVSARLVRQSGCHLERPVQLGKSFSKVRLCSSFPLLPRRC